MIRGIFSTVGAVLLGTMLLRVVSGSMSLPDVAGRGLVILLVISFIDKVVAPMVGAGLRGLNGPANNESSLGTVPLDKGVEPNG